jgi:hypothetical protein
VWVCGCSGRAPSRPRSAVPPEELQEITSHAAHDRGFHISRIRACAFSQARANGRQIAADDGADERLVGPLLLDYDGDGKPDLIAQNSADGRLARLVVVNNKVTASATMTPAPAPGWKLVGPK